MKKVRVLSIDGGGIRGVIPATIIAYVEEQLVKITNNPNARIADYFDLVAGTSTGGILGCFYLSPNTIRDSKEPSSAYTAAQALEFYVKNGYDIFNKSKYFGWLGFRKLFDADSYSAENIEKIFLEKFGDLKMQDLLKRCIVTSYNLDEKKAVFFNSREKPSKNRDYYVRDAVRSTSAAPTYFPPARITNLKTGKELINIDGGVFANNPTMCAFAECFTGVFDQAINPGPRELLILSIGTGGGQFKLPDVTKSNRWGILSWAKSIPEIMMDGSLDTVHFQMQNLYESLADDYKNYYLRIDVPPDKRKYSSDMSDASPKNIENLKIAGEEALKAHEADLNDFILKLIANAPDEETG